MVVVLALLSVAPGLFLPWSLLLLQQLLLLLLCCCCAAAVLPPFSHANLTSAAATTTAATTTTTTSPPPPPPPPPLPPLSSHHRPHHHHHHHHHHHYCYHHHHHHHHHQAKQLNHAKALSSSGRDPDIESMKHKLAELNSTIKEAKTAISDKQREINALKREKEVAAQLERTVQKLTGE
jgi:hypothetical protein